jgi:surfeit locus 1 family protein
MRRLPILSTLIVAAAVAVMIVLGVWQLQRAAWKERLLADLQAAQTMPALDLDPLLARGATGDVPLAFRRVLVSCAPSDTAPSLRGGRSRAGQPGYSYFIRCRPGADGLAGRIEVNAGWASGPDSSLRPRLPNVVAGVLGTVEPAGPIILTAAQPAAGLEASEPPSVDEIPNNHMAYAFQWFFFAATALIVFVFALRRRRSVAPREPQP